MIPTICCVSIERFCCYVKCNSLTLKVYNNTASFATSNDVLCFYIKILNLHNMLQCNNICTKFTGEGNFKSKNLTIVFIKHKLLTLG